MSAPVHVLMLPSSTAASAAKSEVAQPELASFMRENAGDYLDRRCQVLKGQRKVTGSEGIGGSANELATFEQMWSGSSSLEVAIAMCCDHEGEDSAITSVDGENDDTDSSSAMVESGSSDTSAGCDKNVNGDKKQRKKKSSGVYRCGAIGRGKEGKFAALIARHCHTAGDRALCLAVLQRTMERDEMISKQQRGKKRKRNEAEPPLKPLPPPSVVGTKSEETAGSAEDLMPQAESTNSMDTDECEIDCHRMANFLSAGGLKVLNQWLIDAFTPVKTAEPSETQSKKRKQLKDQEITVGTMTSPTGPILLPLLSILQSIPFNIELVKHSQINKQIKKLKKNLDRLVANFDEEESESDSESSSSEDDDEELKGKRQKRTLEALTHPVSGGMPVVQVQKDVEKLMANWKVAAADKSEKGEDFTPGGFYGELRAKMEERFLVLSRFETGEGEKPPWLEKLDPTPTELKSPAQASPASNSTLAQKAAAAVKKKQDNQLKRQSEASKRLQQQQAELKAAQAARLEAREKMEQYRKRMMEREGSMLNKRKADALVESQDGPADKKPASRRVTWADQKVAGAKLVEVREFVRETDVYQSEEEEKRGQDSDDDSDEKFEEDDFDDGDYDDETQASDSVDSDDFDGLNEEDANFSQEEEAGFTFETLGLGGHRSEIGD